MYEWCLHVHTQLQANIIHVCILNVEHRMLSHSLSLSLSLFRILSTSNNVHVHTVKHKAHTDTVTSTHLSCEGKTCLYDWHTPPVVGNLWQPNLVTVYTCTVHYITKTTISINFKQTNIKKLELWNNERWSQNASWQYSLGYWRDMDLCTFERMFGKHTEPRHFQHASPKNNSCKEIPKHDIYTACSAHSVVWDTQIIPYTL